MYNPDIIKFNRIYIIQSLKVDDQRNGEEIVTRIRYRSDGNEDLATLFNIGSEEDYSNVMNQILHEVADGEIKPYIHIESHGNKKGLSLTNGDLIHFNRLHDEMRVLNRISMNNLFISIAACWGGYIQYETDIKKPCPFRGFIGPMEESLPDELLMGFEEYFDQLLLTNSFNHAIKKLNTISRVEYNYFKAEEFFDHVIKLNFENYGSKENFVRELSLAVLRDEWSKNLKAQMVADDFSQFRLKYLNKVEEETDEIIEKMRNKFLNL